MSNTESIAPIKTSANPLNNLPIAQKLALIIVIFVLPILFLLYSDYAARQESITVAQKEISGNKIVVALHDGLEAVVRTAMDNADRLNEIDVETPLAPEEAVAAIEGAAKAAAEARGFEVNAAEVVEKARKFVDEAADMSLADLVKEGLETSNAFNALIGRVSEDSGLILDPELASYYTMAITVLNVPLIGHELTELDLTLAQIRAKPTASAADRTRLLVLDATFLATLAELTRNVEAAYRGDASGGVKAVIDADYQALAAALKAAGGKLDLAIDNMALPGNSTANLPETLAEREAAFEALEKLENTASAELDTLLNQRIARDQRSLWMNILMAVIFSAAAVVLAFIIGRGISGPLKTLSATMNELVKGNLEVDVPERDRGDEVGQMANAVQVFKENEHERIRLAEALPEQEKALAESERHLRSLVRNIPGVPMRTLADANRTVDFVSENLEKVSGYAAKEFVANKERGFASLLHPEDAAEYKRAINEAVAKQQPFSVEYRIMHKDGTPRFIAEKGQAVLGQKGNVAFIDSHLVDRFAEEK